ncbi:MAG: hypothetical protein U0Q11_01500 [Vicinamibacterales bacterium]
MTPGVQAWWLLMLAIPVACISWTVTHEELFSEVHEWCVTASRRARLPAARKFFYLFTCEYCFSHYIAAGMVALTRFHLLLDDWRGVLIAWFSLVWIANVYMSLFGRLRLDIKHERVSVQAEELSRWPIGRRPARPGSTARPFGLAQHVAGLTPTFE